MYKLKLKNVIINAYLGVYDFEQQAAQEVLLDLCVAYHQIPKGCFSDQLEDTVCYADINALLIQTALKKRYQLIEHLAQSLLDALIDRLAVQQVDIYLELHKKPPLDNVSVASFCAEHLCTR